MKAAALTAAVLFLALLCASCGVLAVPVRTAPAAEDRNAAPSADPGSTQEPAQQEEPVESDEEKTLRLFIDDTEAAVSWEENESADALRELAASSPVTVPMSMYGGFEQVGSLGRSLPRNDSRMSGQPGDIMLYNGDQIVIFYGANDWNYTRLGRITGLSAEELTDLLGNGAVTVTLTME